jgi:hypothetical protein
MKTLRMIITFIPVVAIACVVLLLHSIKSLAGDLEDGLLAVANFMIDWVHQTKVSPDQADRELIVGEAICDAHDSYVKTELGKLPRSLFDSDADWKKWVGRAAIQAVKELP